MSIPVSRRGPIRIMTNTGKNMHIIMNAGRGKPTIMSMKKVMSIITVMSMRTAAGMTMTAIMSMGTAAGMTMITITSTGIAADMTMTTITGMG
ncbi:MAG: hypothetical protein K5922_10825 [Clostridiales bacterium]|nr:hypothetical protein [Clostridiales bacterium]